MCCARSRRYAGVSRGAAVLDADVPAADWRSASAAEGRPDSFCTRCDSSCCTIGCKLRWSTCTNAHEKCVESKASGHTPWRISDPVLAVGCSCLRGRRKPILCPGVLPPGEDVTARSLQAPATQCTSLHLESLPILIVDWRVSSQLWSESFKNAASLPTQVVAKPSPAYPCSMPPIIQVCTHSYSSEIADVVAMSSEIGCMSFFTSRGSCGHREPN
jgi:hypothetical protein